MILADAQPYLTPHACWDLLEQGNQEGAGAPPPRGKTMPLISAIPLRLALPVQDRPLDFFPRLREVCSGDQSCRGERRHRAVFVPIFMR